MAERLEAPGQQVTLEAWVVGKDRLVATSGEEDLRALMRQLRIPLAVVVAPGDDIRIALMLAQIAGDTSMQWFILSNQALAGTYSD